MILIKDNWKILVKFSYRYDLNGYWRHVTRAWN